MTFPIGTIITLASNTVPAGWLKCNGNPIDEKYSALIKILNSQNTPNLIGRTLIGAGNIADAKTTQDDKLEPNFSLLPNVLNIGEYGGECAHKLTWDEMPTHSHSINSGNFGTHSRSFKGENASDHPFDTDPANELGGTDNAGGDQSHNNMQAYYVVNYVIYAGND